MGYQILEKDRVKYISLVLLNEIIQYQHYFSVKLIGDDIYLDSFLKTLVTKDFLRVEKSKYVPTDKGRQEIVNLYAKYTEYLKLYDIFCAVDLLTYEFAFSSMPKYGDSVEDGTAWQAFLNEERFSDVRVAVAAFKKLDPTEIVFMSFLQENRFDCTAQRWQYNLTGEDVWHEIEEICNTAVNVEYLTEQGVIEEIITKGTIAALALLKMADDANAQPQVDDEEVVEETTETTEYYVEPVVMPYYSYSYWDPYFYDPFYVSALWFDPVYVW